MRVCLFEDQVETLEPLSLTRPVFDLVCGMTSLGKKLFSHFAPAEPAVVLRDHLAELYRLKHPGLPINDWVWLHQGEVLFVNGRWLPGRLAAGEVFVCPEQPCVGMLGNELAYVFLNQQQVRHITAGNFHNALEEWKQTLPRREVAGNWIHYPWDLIAHNGTEIERDLAVSPATSWVSSQEPEVVGSAELLFVSPRANVEPMVLADTRNGPVIIDHSAQVSAFSRLEGPCYIGPFAQVVGAKIRGGTTLGPHARVGGEVEASIVHGFSNKYHDGFLGHSYLGEWVNLGAGTHTSDLRNDYGEVTTCVAGRPVATGQTKVGAFIGDHTKTGLGTLLNTGSSIGIFCNLLPAGRLAPKYVPSFTNLWNGQLVEGAMPEAFLNVAREVMRRRKAELSSAHSSVYRLIYQETALERRRVIREAEQRMLRKSA